MVTKTDVLKYAETWGNDEAVTFLTLVGPDNFEGTADEFTAMVKALDKNR